ncbi:MAG: HDOD domain-containing protein [Ectothiorhodospiraceae bacterium]|nr:HDOD domain-containing protein [Ectothiorhodospiraceae bacterium]MCH8506624.1 HDOD domain-containing protein [Ectothiorhodospiraceae bacterium]
METPDAAALLNRLLLVDELSEQRQKQLLAKATVERLSPGQELAATAADRYMLFLLEGELELELPQGQRRTLRDDDQRARGEIFPDGQVLRAKAVVGSRILRADRRFWMVLKEDQQRSGYEIREYQAGDREVHLMKRIYQALSSGDLKLPAIPRVMAQLQGMDEEAGLAELVRIIQLDPGIAARMVQVANSPMYRREDAVRQLREAVGRLGFRTARRLAVAHSVAGLLKSRVPGAARRLGRLWEHSMKVSVLSFVLARRQQDVDPEAALLAGLIHDIGSIPVLMFAAEEGYEREEELEQAIQSLRGLIGVLLLQNWGFEQEFVDVAEAAEDWYRQRAVPDLCAVVVVAKALSMTPEQRLAAGCPEPELLPSLELLHRSAGIKAADLLAEGREEMEQARQLLSG